MQNIETTKPTIQFCAFMPCLEHFDRISSRHTLDLINCESTVQAVTYFPLLKILGYCRKGGGGLLERVGPFLDIASGSRSI